MSLQFRIWLRRIRTLVENANPQRLRRGVSLLTRGDFHRLAVLVKLHTELRSRISDPSPLIQGAPFRSGLFAPREEVV